MNNIIFICNCLHNGGAQRVLVSIANYFSNKNYQVVIVASFNNGSYKLNENVKVIYVGYRKYFKYIKLVRRIIKQLNPKAVISFEYFFNILASIACLGLNNKLIISERNDPSKEGSGIIKDRIRNLLYKRANILVCQTPDAIKYFPDYIQKKSVIIPNPLKPHLPKSNVLRRSKDVVTFCRLHPQKNLPLLVRAFSEFTKTHSDYTLKIYGDGSERDIIEVLAKTLNISNKVYIFDSIDTVHEKVINSCMFVLPSNYEGISNSMLEALAMGIPTICTDCPCGGARMFIQNGINGILVPVEGEKELVNAMTKIADNKDFAETLSREGVKIREQLSIERIGNMWINLL